MGCKVLVLIDDNNDKFNVWLKVNGNKYKIGDGFSFSQDESRNPAWNLALKLACQLEEDLLGGS